MTSLGWTMIPTTIPELNEILGGGFPDKGLSMIVGAPGAGKTLLAANVSAVALQDSKADILLLCEDRGEVWNRMVNLQSKTLSPHQGSQRVTRTWASTIRLSTTTLVIVDNNQSVPDEVVRYSLQRPVILTRNESQAHTTFTRSASLVLHLERARRSDQFIARVTKNREGRIGEFAVFKYDRGFGLVGHEGPRLSRWERLLSDEELC